VYINGLLQSCFPLRDISYGQSEIANMRLIDLISIVNRKSILMQLQSEQRISAHC